MLRQLKAPGVALWAALAACPVGCGDDASDDAAPPDGGDDSGTAGRSHAGRGGFSGNGSGGAGPSVAECVDETMMTTDGAVERECISCSCERGPALAVLCNETCWDLVTCYAASCGDVDVSDMNAVAGCAFMHCEEFVGAITPATELIKIIAQPCRGECIGKMTPPEDAGIDAGD